MRIDTDYVLNEIIQHIEELVTPRIDRERTYEQGMYPCIPFSNQSFLNRLQDAMDILQAVGTRDDKGGRPKFIDVGCGIGMKVKMAALAGLEAHGIEYHKEYVRLAHRLVNQSCITRGDAREYKRYGEFDIIYFYCPMANHDLQIQLEKTIYEQAKEGAVLIEALKQNDYLEASEPQLRRIHREVYMKTSDLELAEWLRQMFRIKERRATRG